MSESFSNLHQHLIQLANPISESLSRTHYTPQEGNQVSAKSIVESLLPNRCAQPNPSIIQDDLNDSIKNFALACALLSSSLSSNHELLSWIPENLSDAATTAFLEFSTAYCGVFGERNEKRINELGLDFNLLGNEKRLVVELMPEVIPLLKERIKESSIDKINEDDEAFAASARVPVGYAILATYQFRWFVTQVGYPQIGKLTTLVIPCALTALDHWSPEVKGQGMISFIHLGKNVNATDLDLYGDVILDACCQNIASSDEIWHNVVEMSVLLITSIHGSNPRSSWFEKMLNEMLSHLERQPRNKDRRIAWLKLCQPFFSAVGLVLLAHFKRIFPLFFQWMHADDDETVLLVLNGLHTIIRLTWIRNTPYVERLADELAVLYKEASLRNAREEIRTHIHQILILLQQCKGLQFETVWEKHRDDPNLNSLGPSLNGRPVHPDQSSQSERRTGAMPLRAQ